MTKPKIALVTGASSGIGEATARALHAEGYKVYAAARRTDRMEGLHESGVRVITLDVTDEDSIQQALQLIKTESGALDVLINNAGYGSYGALEDVPMTEARRQIEVNLFALARLMQLVLPDMRQARSGTIINISSVGGRLGETFGAWYHASKYAVEGLSDSVALEVAPFGVRVITVEPGAIKTEWSEIAADGLLKASGNGAYAAAAQKKAAILRKFNDLSVASPPEAVAKSIVRILKKQRPAMRYPVGGGAPSLMLLRRFTSDRLFYRIVSRFLG